MSKKLKILVLLLILISIPLTVILANQVQNYLNFAAEAPRKMALGISLPYGRASRDINTDASIAEIEKFASPVSEGGVGAYPATYSIWTDFDESNWKYGSRSKFPNQKLLNYLDSKKITPVIFMAPVGAGMTKTSGTLTQAQKFSNQSIANGSYDAYLIEWAQAAKAYGKPVVLRYAWEMNGNWFPWSPYNPNSNYYDVGNTPENYVAAWRHVYNVIKPIAPNVKFYWCANGVSSSPNAKMASFYPGNNYVDYVGFDEYNWYPSRTANETLSNAWNESVLAIRHIVTGSETTPSTIPILIGETGLLSNNELRNEKLNYNTIYNTYPDLKGIMYFDIDVDYLFGVNAEPGRNWRLSGKSENPAITTQGVDLRPKYNTFVTQDKFKGYLNPSYEQAPTNTPAPATNTPSPIISQPNSPTPGQTTGTVKIKIPQLKLHGIGTGGDNANPNASGNTNPNTKIKNVKVEIYDDKNNLIGQTQANLAYSSTLGYFTGEIPFTTNAADGTFVVIKIKTDKYLKKQAPGFYTLNKGGIITLLPVDLVTGNTNNDEFLTILDYNTLTDCYSDFLPAKNCTDQNKKLNADLTDDGNVNQADYNLFIREFSNISGD